MHIFGHFRPQKIAEHGDRQVEAARHLLVRRGGELSRQRYDEAHGHLAL